MGFASQTHKKRNENDTPTPFFFGGWGEGWDGIRRSEIPAQRRESDLAVTDMLSPAGAEYYSGKGLWSNVREQICASG